MAKKKFDYKNVKINEEELSITKIGEITTGNQSPLFIFVFLGILLVFIFFLPNLVNLIDERNEKPDYNVTEGNDTNNGNKEDDSLENKITYYDFNNELVVNLENNIVINNFSLNGNKLSFNITNSNNNNFNFKTSNYFLEIYTNDNMLLERIMLGDIIVLRDSSRTFEYSLSDESIANMKKIAFVQKNITDYPNVTLEKNDKGESSLSCTLNTEVLNYSFLEDKLVTITDDFRYSNEFSDYDNIFRTWQATTTNLNDIVGVSSMFVDTGSSFGANVTLDLKEINFSNLNNPYYYKYQTEAKVVKFEMEARGFSCK